MNIGIVCEGPTDYPAIQSFLGSALKGKGLSANFQSLFPDLDKTRPEGGWGNVLSWLQKYPAQTRVQRYFGDASFQKHVADKFRFSVESPIEPNQRAEQIKGVLRSALELDDMTNIDAARHIIAAAVESTEAWCVAAFHPRSLNSESLQGKSLVNAFMKALEASEGKALQDTYSSIDKDYNRRRLFCKKHAKNSDRITKDCRQFASTLDQLITLAPS